MLRQIHLNLPVQDLKRSKAFFAGFGFDSEFPGEQAARLKAAAGAS